MRNEPGELSVATRETERAELHKTIWRIANDLRGSVDGWDFKTYVLGMLFYRFISENLAAYLNEIEREDITALNADIVRIVIRQQELRIAIVADLEGVG